MLIFNPLNQFEIYPVFFIKFWHICIIINNFSFYSFLIFLFFLILFLLSKKQKILFYSNIIYFVFIKLILFLQSILKQNIITHPYLTQSFLPLAFTLFIMIILTNVFGLIPFSFTNTSYIIQTFMLSCSFFIGLTLFAIIFQGFDTFLKSFIPEDIPQALKPLLVLIELISYFSRAFSLAIRLFANMMAGHTLLHILSDFSLKLGKIKYIFFIFPLIIVFLISILEIGVSFLQGYVFTLLISLYYNESFKILIIDSNLFILKKFMNKNKFYDYLKKNKFIF